MNVSLRQAMRRMAASVCIVAAGRVGRRYGMTATSVTSLSIEPPSLLVCLNRQSATFATICEDRRFSVNVLTAHQIEYARVFCSTEVTGERRFADGTWQESPDGIPHLQTANASVLCQVEAIVPYGSHAAFIGGVIDVHLGQRSAEPLLYFDGDYSALLPRGS